jgi:hypothetical protein
MIRSLAKADVRVDETGRSDLVEQYSHRAVAWLREAFRRGCTEYPFLKTDPGLDVLRARDDWKRSWRPRSTSPRTGS